MQRTAKELEQLQALQQVRQAVADSAELMAPVARRKIRKEIEKVILMIAAWKNASRNVSTTHWAGIVKRQWVAHLLLGNMTLHALREW